MAVLRSENPSDLTHFIYDGLLDTGATSSWISPKVVKDLELNWISKERVSFALDQQVAYLYLFRLGLFDKNSTMASLPHIFAETQGFRLKQRDDFDVILGMDVLSQGDFRMDRSGAWLLIF